jgi:hypothetical protein
MQHLCNWSTSMQAKQNLKPFLQLSHISVFYNNNVVKFLPSAGNFVSIMLCPIMRAQISWSPYLLKAEVSLTLRRWPLGSVGDCGGELVAKFWETD